MKVDARQRVERKYYAALLRLMAEKDYSSISISELVRAAASSRATFYRNFQGKDEVLERGLDRNIEEILAAMGDLESWDAKAVREKNGIFRREMELRREDFRIIWRSSKHSEVRERVRDKIYLFILRDRLENYPMKISQGQREKAAHLFTSAVLSTIDSFLSETPLWTVKQIFDAIFHFGQRGARGLLDSANSEE